MSLTITSPTTGQILEVNEGDAKKKLTREQAIEACNTVGGGTRLPTLEELQVMYKELHLNGKGNFADEDYLCYTLSPSGFHYSVCFKSGIVDDYYESRGDNDLFRVRVVRETWD